MKLCEKGEITMLDFLPTYVDSEGDHVDPQVPITIRKRGGVYDFTLGSHDPVEEDQKKVPLLIIERRPTGWVIEILTDSLMDNDCTIHVLDSQRIVIQPENPGSPVDYINSQMDIEPFLEVEN